MESGKRDGEMPEFGVEEVGESMRPALSRPLTRQSPDRPVCPFAVSPRQRPRPDSFPSLFSAAEAALETGNFQARLVTDDRPTDRPTHLATE